MTDTIVLLCRRKVRAYARTHAAEWTADLEAHSAAVTEIVTRNYTSGRIHRMRRLPPGALLGSRALGEYISRVLPHYHRSYARIVRLQAYDPHVWDDLFAELLHAATLYLRRHVTLPAKTPEDYAQSACLNIRQSIYPFDVPFEAWMKRVLINGIIQEWRSGDVLARGEFGVVSLDRQSYAEGGDDPARTRHEQIHDERADKAFQQVDDADLVWNAIGELRSRRQREVLIATYRDGLSDEDIARRLGRTQNAVQVLRHRALAALKKNMEQVKESRRNSRQ